MSSPFRHNRHNRHNWLWRRAETRTAATAISFNMAVAVGRWVSVQPKPADSAITPAASFVPGNRILGGVVRQRTRQHRRGRAIGCVN